ncbi:MAG: hypothetical protein EA383_17525 [Spirochaetaceae bacterium]|nr:MAG: hypothetical protein EA383_17525 [Spirochaetaceae bacterium]
MDAMHDAHHRGFIIILLILLLSGGAHTLWPSDHLSVEAQAAVVLLQGATGADFSVFSLPPSRASRELQGQIDAGIGLGYTYIRLTGGGGDSFTGSSHTASLLGLIAYRPPLETRLNARISLRYGLAVSGFGNDALVTQPAFVLTPGVEILTQNTDVWTYGLSAGLRGVIYAVASGGPPEIGLTIGLMVQRDLPES